MSKLGDEWIVFDQQNQKREVNIEHEQKFELIDDKISYLVTYVKQLNDQHKELNEKLKKQTCDSNRLTDQHKELNEKLKEQTCDSNRLTDKVLNQEMILQKVLDSSTSCEEMYQEVSIMRNDIININNNITFLLNKVDELENKFTTLSNNYNEISKKKIIYVHK